MKTCSCDHVVEERRAGPALPGQGSLPPHARASRPDPDPRAPQRARPRRPRAARADRDRAEHPVSTARRAAAYGAGELAPPRRRGRLLDQRAGGARLPRLGPADPRPSRRAAERLRGRADPGRRLERLVNTDLLPRRVEWVTATRRPGKDLLAGLMVGLVALPLALGFGVSSGLGAGAGLVTAIVAGVVAAVFGGSNLQVSGPTGAMTVVLVPIIARYGADGVLVVGLLAGVILIGLAYARLGRFIRYVPIPVVEGFTLGIAVIITLQQVPSALGVQVHADKAIGVAGRAVATWFQDPSW